MVDFTAKRPWIKKLVTKVGGILLTTIFKYFVDCFISFDDIFKKSFKFVCPLSRLTSKVALTENTSLLVFLVSFKHVYFICRKEDFEVLTIEINHFQILSQDNIIKLMSSSYGLVVHLNEQGEITRTLQDPTGGKVPSVSEVEDHHGVLYLGSYFLPHISKLYLTDVKDEPA